MLRETIAVAATLCGTVPALLPLAERGMANTHDGLIHVQRLIALESVVRQGAPFTRWLPDLAYGYGQPLLLYYAPLAYLPALAARFLGVGLRRPASRSRAGWRWCSRRWRCTCWRARCSGPLAAAAAAIVYAVLPYQLVDLYVRGALAESLGVRLAAAVRLVPDSGLDDGRPRWSVGLALQRRRGWC